MRHPSASKQKFLAEKTLTFGETGLYIDKRSAGDLVCVLHAQAGALHLTLHPSWILHTSYFSCAVDLYMLPNAMKTNSHFHRLFFPTRYPCDTILRRARISRRLPTRPSRGRTPSNGDLFHRGQKTTKLATDSSMRGEKPSRKNPHFARPSKDGGV